MSVLPYCMAAGVALLAGLDRTALFQSMVSRPMVAAPLTGWLLGDVVTGVQIGALLELLWLGRIPVGASIPPDDTQVAVGGVCLALTQPPGAGMSTAAFAVLCLLVALPFGRLGVFFDRVARRCNDRLWERADAALEKGAYGRIQRLHLRGALHFAGASLFTFGVIVAGGWLSLRILVPLFGSDLDHMLPWLMVGVPLVGVSACLATVNFRRAGLLFGLAFLGVYGLLWAIG